MADSKRTSSDADSKTKQEAPGAGVLAESLMASFQDYLNQLQQAGTNAQKRCVQAQTDLTLAMREIQLDAQKGHEEAYRNYLRGAQDACSATDACEQMRATEQRYMKDVESVQNRVRQRVDDANRAASNSMQEANDAATKAWEEARQNYVKKVQESVSRLDPRSIPPDSLAMLGQSLLAASYYARITQRH